MIPFTEITGVLRAIVADVTESAGNANEEREQLTEFANEHDLSIQQTAALFRVHSGEAIESES